MRVERKPFFVALGAMLLGAIAVVAFLLAPTQEKAVRKAIGDMASACQAENVAAFGALVSEEYRGDVADGKQALLDKADNAFKNCENLSVKIDYAEIHVEGYKAKALVSYEVSGAYISSGVYSKAPFSISVSRPVGELTGLAYMEFALEEDAWRAEYVAWKVDSYLLDFPKAAQHLGRKLK